MIPAKVRAKLAQAAKPQPIVVDSWHEVNGNGGVVKLFTVECQACGGKIHTHRKGTIYHPDCSFSKKEPLDTRKIRRKLQQLRPLDKDRMIIRLMEQIQTYQSRYGSMLGKEHIKVSDALIRAMNDKGRYEKLNMIAGEWLEGE